MTLIFFAAFLACILCGGLSSVGLCSTRFLSARLSGTDIVAPPSAATIAVIFALFVAFGASEITQQSRELRLAVQKEVNVARAIFKYAESIGPSANPVRQSLIEYLQGVTALEPAWLDSPVGTESPAQPTADALVQVITLFVVQSSATPPVKALVVSKVDELRQARTEGISSAIKSSGIPQWVGLTVMGMLTQFILALGYVGKPRSMRLVTGCFTVAAAFAMCYLAWMDGLIGPSKITTVMQPLKDLLTTISS